MNYLRRLTPSPSAVAIARNHPAQATGVSALALVLLVWCVRDYRAFLALGRGGVPYNPLGWAAITFLIRPFALSKTAAMRTDDYPATGAHEDVAALPPRTGSRAQVGGIAPHRQLSQHPPEELREDIHNLFANAAAVNPEILEIKTSGYERHNDALFVAEKLLRKAQASGLPQTAVIANGEIGHPHPDLSIHLYMSPADARVLIEKGWAERHRMSVPAGSLSRNIPIFSRIGDTFLMIYGPRDEGEMAVLGVILRNSIRFMTRQEDFQDPEWKIRVSK
ncbi:uncharacterized protein LTHEOB_10122 [Neofusicoccum parvum]|uniref:Luciferase domain-containing protein n=1 Tax=Neofusicoccum ribis TaxID=45134 RepID=A0ABR3SX25_9PEZI|nr:uncharacterized protein LTHEOB_10122 [Neofusicoccum parvum]